MKYIHFGGVKPLERKKLNELIEMIQENLLEIHGGNKEDLLPLTQIVQETKHTSTEHINLRFVIFLLNISNSSITASLF